MGNWIDQTRNIQDDIKAIAYRIDKLSRAFRTTGNITLAEELEYYTMSLCDQVEKISKVVSDKLDNDLREAKITFFGGLSTALNPTKDQD